MSCVTIEFVACAPSTDKLLPWVHPKVDCRPAFVDSGAPGRGCAYSSLSEQDGHRSSFRGRAWRPHVHRRPDHVDDSWRQPHDHDFRRNPDLIWDDSGIDSDHADTEHSTTAPSLQGKEDRRLGSFSSPWSHRSQALWSFPTNRWDLAPIWSSRADGLFRLLPANSCRHTRTAGDVSDNNFHPHGVVRRIQGRPRPESSLWTKQFGRSLLTAHPIPFQQGGVVAETEQSTSSPLRQHGVDPCTAERPGFQHQLQHRIRPYRSYCWH